MQPSKYMIGLCIVVNSRFSQTPVSGTPYLLGTDLGFLLTTLAAIWLERQRSFRLYRERILLSRPIRLTPMLVRH